MEQEIGDKAKSDQRARYDQLSFLGWSRLSHSKRQVRATRMVGDLN